MAGYTDVSVRVLDPDDEHRLFAFPRDRACALTLLRAAWPDGGAAVIAPPLYYELAGGADDVRAVNDVILDLAGETAAAAAFGVVEPRHMEAAQAELQRLAQKGALGVVWSPRAQGLMADDRLMIEACRQAQACGLVSMIQAHPYSANEGLERIWRLARSCPGLPLLVSGALMSWEAAQSILAGRGGEPNLIYDTAGMMGEGVSFEQLIGALGEERLVFGTGGRDRGGRIAAEVRARLARSSLSPAAQEKILTGNAARVLGVGAAGAGAGA